MTGDESMTRHIWRALSLALALALVLAPAASAKGENRYIARTARVGDMADVPSDAYYRDAVDWALVNGIANGTGSNTFSPEQLCTRAHVVTFLWRAAGEPEPRSSANPFADVAGTKYYYKPVLWAVERGITNGTGKNTFSPDDSCTTEQIITFLHRAAGSPRAASPSALGHGWSAEALAWAGEKGLASFADSSALAASCTRADTVYYLYKTSVEVPDGAGCFESYAPAALNGGVYTASNAQELTSALITLIASYEGRVSSGGAEDSYASGRLIMRAEGQLSPESFGAAQTVAGPGGVYFLQFTSATDAKACAEQLRALEQVKYAEPDLPLSTCLTGESGASVYGEQTGVPGYAGALASGGTDTNITVALVDTGVDTSHPFLSGRCARGYDLTGADAGAGDTDGHGTFAAGVIAACTQGTGVRIMPVRVTRGAAAYASVTAQGVLCAVQHGAAVIELALCGGHSNYLEEAVSSALSCGVTVVAAAGNGGRTAGEYCPAHMEGCITVAAVNAALEHPDFSNYGSAVDICAPGDGIVSCVPGGGFESGSGTSAAASHAAAACALLLCDRGRSMLPHRVESLIKSAARDLGYAPYFGAGLLDMTPFFGAAEAGATPAQETKVYMVAFDPCGGTVSTASVRVNAGESFGTLPTPVREGWRFDGWYTAVTGGQHARSIDLPGSDLILYAHWTRLDTIVYTVSFDPCGGTVSTTQMRADADKPFGSLPLPVREGWRFDGWYTAAAGGQLVREIDYPGSDLILYAHWTRQDGAGTAQPGPAPAQSDRPTCGDGLDWSLAAGTLTIFGNGAMYDFTSPDDTPWALERRTIRLVVVGEGVTHIGDYAFCNFAALSSVQLPARLESIGVYAFAGCPFQSLDLSGTIGTISAHAFENCGIISLTLSGNMGNIGSHAFARCVALTLLEISGEVNRIGTGAFEDCNSLWSVTITGKVNSTDDTAFPEGTTIYRG